MESTPGDKYCQKAAIQQACRPATTGFRDPSVNTSAECGFVHRNMEAWMIESQKGMGKALSHIRVSEGPRFLINVLCVATV